MKMVNLSIKIINKLKNLKIIIIIILIIKVAKRVIVVKISQLIIVFKNKLTKIFKIWKKLVCKKILEIMIY